jgi:hypothetical protein
MRKQLVISVGTIIAIMAMITPVFAQGFGGGPGGFGPVGPAGCGFGAPLGGFGPGIGGCGPGIGGFGPGIGGCGPGIGGFGPGIGGCGFGDPLTGIVGLGIAMIDSVLGAAFSCIPLGLGGFGFGGCGIPFGGFC